MWAIEALQIIVRRRRFVIVNTAIVTIAAIIISLVLPKTYQSKATILPPESESPLAGLAGLSTGQIAAAVTNFTLPLMATPSDLYASMLQSETVLKRVVDSLDLRAVYDTRTAWDAVGQLKKNTKVSVAPDGIITVEANAKTPQLAAAIANSLVATLDDFNRRLQNQKGRDFSGFLERRLVETDSSLRVAQDRLKEFQQEHHAVALEQQSEALIANLAAQKASLTTAEIELEMLRKTLYPSHPEVVKKEMIVSEIKRKLREIEAGAATQADSALSALDIPLTRVPDLSLQFAVLRRNLKIQELTYELLSQQLEMARLQERRNTPTIMVLDGARPPDRAAKPRKRMIVTVAFILSFLFSGLLAVGFEGFRDRRGANHAVAGKLSDIYREIKSKPLG